MRRIRYDAVLQETLIVPGDLGRTPEVDRGDIMAEIGESSQGGKRRAQIVYFCGPLGFGACEHDGAGLADVDVRPVIPGRVDVCQSDALRTPADRLQPHADAYAGRGR